MAQPANKNFQTEVISRNLRQTFLYVIKNPVFDVQVTVRRDEFL